MACGLYLWPPGLLVKEPTITDEPLSFLTVRLYDDPIELEVPLTALETTLHVTKHGGLFVHLPKPPSIMASHLNVSNRTPANVEEQQRSTHRLCEYIATFISCLNNKIAARGHDLTINPFFTEVVPTRLIQRPTDRDTSPFTGTTLIPAGSSPDAMSMIVPAGVQWPKGIFFQITHKEITDAATEFNDLVSKDDTDPNLDIISLVSQFYNSCYSFTTLDWIGCIVTAFGVAEALAQEAWRRHVHGKSQAAIIAPLSGRAREMARRRARALAQGRPWTPRVSELLEAALQTGQIRQDTYNNLDETRQARNDWIHGQVHPSLESARNAMDGAARIFKDICGVSLRRAMGISYSTLLFT